MLKRTGFIIVTVFIFLVLLSFIQLPFFSSGMYSRIKKKQTENHAPVVKIIAPKNQSAYRINALVPYEISVSDKEDGESKYQEINPKEVFLQIIYVDDTSKALSLIRKNNMKDAAGLASIKTSNCMNCHAFKTKLIGPSFYDITKRYALVAKTEDTLAHHVLNGSRGRWGNVQMPSNTAIDEDEAKKIIEWIFKHAGDTTVNYLAGAEGTFRLNPPTATLRNVILIASYTDHGTKEKPHQNLKGEDIVTILGK